LGNAWHTATISDRFVTIIGGVKYTGIPPFLPQLAWPWGSDWPAFSFLHALFLPAFAIAMLGAIESLLSAVIADGMAGTQHDPDAELIALGIGNLVAPLVGGIAATGALARTATNVRFGARSPVAAMVHATVVALAIIALAPVIGHIPMAALAGLLMFVAFNMSERKQVVSLLRRAPRDDVIVLIICFALTVMFDMVVAIAVGVVLAALMFMRRMAALTQATVVSGAVMRNGGIVKSVDSHLAGLFSTKQAEHNEKCTDDLPASVSVYRIDGPLFFGAAQPALEMLRTTLPASEALVIDLRNVPVIDATGMVALETALEGHLRGGRVIAIAAVSTHAREQLKMTATLSSVPIATDLDGAVAAAISKLPSSHTGR
jgi:SulP family sulfate permease